MNSKQDLIEFIMEFNAQEEFKSKLKEQFRKHVSVWDYYHDEPIEEDHAQHCVDITMKLLSEAFVAGRSKMSWKEFLESKGIKQ